MGTHVALSLGPSKLIRDETATFPGFFPDFWCSPSSLGVGAAVPSASTRPFEARAPFCCPSPSHVWFCVGHHPGRGICSQILTFWEKMTRKLSSWCLFQALAGGPRLRQPEGFAALQVGRKAGRKGKLFPQTSLDLSGCFLDLLRYRLLNQGERSFGCWRR